MAATFVPKCGQPHFEMSVYVVRAFVRLRDLLASNTALARKLDELERKYQHHDDAIKAILSAIRELMNSPQPKRRPIGFTADLSKKSPALAVARARGVSVLLESRGGCSRRASGRSFRLQGALRLGSLRVA